MLVINIRIDNIHNCIIQLEEQTWPYYAHKYCRGKRKAIPLQAWTGLEGSRRLRLPDFKTVGTSR